MERVHEYGNRSSKHFSVSNEESWISSHTKSRHPSLLLLYIMDNKLDSFKSLIVGMDGTLNSTHSINLGSSGRPLPDNLLAEILS